MNFTIFSQLNWPAVAVAGLAYFLLGAIWYSFLFKNAWVRASGVDMNAPDAKKGVAGVMISSLLLMIVTSMGMAVLVERTMPFEWMGAVKLGLLAGVCFSVTGISISYLYEKKPLALHLINGGYHVLGCVISAVILTLWH
jgi:hypothetical protein